MGTHWVGNCQTWKRQGSSTKKAGIQYRARCAPNRRRYAQPTCSAYRRTRPALIPHLIPRFNPVKRQGFNTKHAAQPACSACRRVPPVCCGFAGKRLILCAGLEFRVVNSTLSPLSLSPRERSICINIELMVVGRLRPPRAPVAACGRKERATACRLRDAAALRRFIAGPKRTRREAGFVCRRLGRERFELIQSHLFKWDRRSRVLSRSNGPVRTARVGWSGWFADSDAIVQETGASSVQHGRVKMLRQIFFTPPCAAAVEWQPCILYIDCLVRFKCVMSHSPAVVAWQPCIWSADGTGGEGGGGGEEG